MKKELIKLNTTNKVGGILNNSVILNLNLTYFTNIKSLRLYSTKVENINSRINEIIEDIKETKNFNTAFTHKSYIKNDPSIKSYENLAFYGNKILETYVTYILNYIYPDKTNNELNELKASLIDFKSLKEISQNINLSKYIKIKRIRSGPILIAVLKSFIAALYI